MNSAHPFPTDGLRAAKDARCKIKIQDTLMP